MPRRAVWMISLLTASAALAAPRQARVRFLIAAPGLESARCYLDGQPATEELAFGRLSTYQPVAAGRHEVQVFAVDGKLIDNRATRFEAGFDCTLAVAGDPPALLRVRDRAVAHTGRAFVRAVHLAHGIETILLRPKGDPLLGTMQYGQALRPVDVAPSEYLFELLTAESAPPLLVTEPLRCDAGWTTCLWLLPDPAAKVRVVVDAQQPGPPEGYAGGADPAPAEDSRPLPLLRLLNVAAGTDPLDVRLGAFPLVSGLGFGQATDYLSVEPGQPRAECGPAGAPLAAADLALARGQWTTLLIYSSAPHVQLWPLSDSPPEDGPAALRVANACADLPEVEVTLAGDPTWRQQVRFPDATAHLAAPAAAKPLQFEVRRPGDSTLLRTVEVQLEHGVRYTLVLCGYLKPAQGQPALTAKLVREAAAP